MGAQPGGPTLADLGEAGLLEQLLRRLPTGPGVLVGPGDDTAVLAADGPVLATTDALVRGRDWRDAWSSPQDVGAKAVVQNLADLAAMGGEGTGLLVTLVAPSALPAAWAIGLTEGIAEAAREYGVPVVGGDLSSSEGTADDGPVVVSMTALGRLPGPGPVLRSGARAGDVLVHRGRLGRSAAGLELLHRGEAGRWPAPAQADAAADLVGWHCRPRPDLRAGPAAAAAGVSAMIDVSDGLGRDAGRIAVASGVAVVLEEAAVASAVAELADTVGADCALACVLGGGEDHGLLATTAPGAVPDGWAVLGRVLSLAEGDRATVTYREQDLAEGGWDHFRG